MTPSFFQCEICGENQSMKKRLTCSHYLEIEKKMEKESGWQECCRRNQAIRQRLREEDWLGNYHWSVLDSNAYAFRIWWTDRYGIWIAYPPSLKCYAETIMIYGDEHEFHFLEEKNCVDSYEELVELLRSLISNNSSRMHRYSRLF